MIERFSQSHDLELAKLEIEKCRTNNCINEILFECCTLNSNAIRVTVHRQKQALSHVKCLLMRSSILLVFILELKFHFKLH